MVQRYKWWPYWVGTNTFLINQENKEEEVDESTRDISENEIPTWELVEEGEQSPYQEDLVPS